MEEGGKVKKKKIRGSLFASLLASESDLLKEITPKNLHSSLQALGHSASEESRQPEHQSWEEARTGSLY